MRLAALRCCNARPSVARSAVAASCRALSAAAAALPPHPWHVDEEPTDSATLKALGECATQSLVDALWVQGWPCAYVEGVRPLAPGTKMVGNAVTLRFVPHRPDVAADKPKGPASPEYIAFGAQRLTLVLVLALLVRVLLVLVLLRVLLLLLLLLLLVLLLNSSALSPSPPSSPPRRAVRTERGAGDGEHGSVGVRRRGHQVPASGAAPDRRAGDGRLGARHGRACGVRLSGEGWWCWWWRWCWWWCCCSG